MFYKYFRNKINDKEKVQDSYAILFSNDDKIRKQYNLSYLGEVFERHQDRNLNVEDILFAAVLGSESNQYFIDDSINTNQFQMFINRYSSEMDTCYKATNHLAFIILLSLMNKNAEAEEELLSFINNNPLNEDFLLLLEGFKDNVFTLSDAVLKAIVNKLENDKFDIDFENLLNVMLNNYASSTVYINIRDIIKILQLKSGMFKNKERFKILNSYKKIGSNRIDKDDAQNMLKCFAESEDVFWLLNLKIANETLSQYGDAILTAAHTFRLYIASSINTDRENFDLFGKLKDIDFRCKDFSNVDESKYLNLIVLYKYNTITAKNIGKNIFTSSSFIQQFYSAIDNDIISKQSFVGLYIDAISTLDNMEDKLFCFNLIKAMKIQFHDDAYVSLIKAGLMNIDEAMSIAKENLIVYLHSDANIDNVELAIAIVNNVLNGNIELENIYEHYFYIIPDGSYCSKSIYSCTFVYETLQTYLEEEVCSLCTQDKIELIQKLERFLYITSNNYTCLENSLYLEFILYAFNNELYKTALNLSEEDIQTISKSLLDLNKIHNSNIIHILNKFAYSEREANLIKLKKEYESLKNSICTGHIYKESIRVSEFLDKASKLDTREEYTQDLVELTESLLDLNSNAYINLLVNLYKANVLSIDQRNKFMCLKLDQICTQ